MVIPAARPSCYAFDTSALIEFKSRYPNIAVFQGFWRHFEGLIAAGRARCPEEVLQELVPKDDELLSWAKVHGELFEPMTHDLWDCSREVAREFPGLCNWDKEIAEADPFVVAIALLGMRRSEAAQEPCLWSVVTMERRPRGKTGIPEVCLHFGVPVPDLIGFFAAEGLTTT